MDITQLLAFSVKNKASDLHLSAGLPPMIRVHGDVRRINVDPLEHKQVHDMVYDIMNDAQRKQYDELENLVGTYGIKLLIDQGLGLNILSLCKSVVALDAKYELAQVVMSVAAHKLTNRVNFVLRSGKDREEKVALMDACLAGCGV